MQLLLICTSGLYSSLFLYPTSNWTLHFCYDRPCGEVMSTTWSPRGQGRLLRSAVRSGPAQITLGSVDVVIYRCCCKCSPCVITAYCFISHYSCVSLVTATPFRVGGKLIFPQKARDLFPFSGTSRPAVGPTKMPVQWRPEFCRGCESPGACVIFSLRSNAEVKNEWSHTSFLSIRLHGANMASFNIYPLLL
jgi:hypothetical protein